MARHKTRPEMFAAYKNLCDLDHSPAQAFDIGWREGATAARLEIETEFWALVDRHGFRNLPSDMWRALNIIIGDYEDE